MTTTGVAAQHAGDDAAGVAFDGGLREVGDLGVGDEDRIGDGVGHRAQAGAEDDAEARAGAPIRLRRNAAAAWTWS